MLQTITSNEDVVRSRQLARALAQKCGLSLVDQTKLVTAASELARNTLIQVPSRSPPPSVAASDAENAPMNSDSVSQIAVCIAALRAASRSAFTWVTTSLTRFSASAWLNPVRAETTLAT